MARIRSIHPGLWTDETFVSVSIPARLLYIGLLNESDDNGVFEWKPLSLKMKLYPADNVDVPAMLKELQDADRLSQYEVQGRSYGLIRNFTKFQRPKKPNPIHPIPNSLREYSGGEGTYKDNAVDEDDLLPTEQQTANAGGEPVGNQFPTEGEIPPQMEEEGDKREESDSAKLDRSPEACAKRPKMPRLSDPTDEWYKLLCQIPGIEWRRDASTRVSEMWIGSDKWQNWAHLKPACEKILRAAKMYDDRWRGDWDTVVGWVSRDGLSVTKHIIPAVEENVAKWGNNYQAPDKLSGLRHTIVRYLQKHKAAA